MIDMPETFCHLCGKTDADPKVPLKVPIPGVPNAPTQVGLNDNPWRQRHHVDCHAGTDHPTAVKARQRVAEAHAAGVSLAMYLTHLKEPAI